MSNKRQVVLGMETSQRRIYAKSETDVNTRKVAGVVCGPHALADQLKENHRIQKELEALPADHDRGQESRGYLFSPCHDRAWQQRRGTGW